MGIEPIDFRTIAAWCGLRRITLDEWELSALRRMDMARLRAVREPKVKPMTPGMFKTMFG
jgi:hypothetical protein